MVKKFQTFNTKSVNYFVSIEIDIYAWYEPGIGRYWFSFGLTSIIFFIILFIIETDVCAKARKNIFESPKKSKNSSKNSNEIEIDDDILNEKQKVNALTTSDIHFTDLVLKNISKSYGHFLAVNQISFTVDEGDFIGIAGMKNAGKTTIFKMLTGEEEITSGEAYVKNFSLKRDMSIVNKIIGYCPQNDALIRYLTGAETLEMFALIRGIRRKDISDMEKRLAEELHFDDEIDQRIEDYSDCNKRKMQVIIALIGNPVVVFLGKFNHVTINLSIVRKMFH